MILRLFLTFLHNKLHLKQTEMLFARSDWNWSTNNVGISRSGEQNATKSIERNICEKSIMNAWQVVATTCDAKRCHTLEWSRRGGVEWTSQVDFTALLRQCTLRAQSTSGITQKPTRTPLRDYFLESIRQRRNSLYYNWALISLIFSSIETLPFRQSIPPSDAFTA